LILTRSAIFLDIVNHYGNIYKFVDAHLNDMIKPEDQSSIEEGHSLRGTAWYWSILFDVLVWYGS